MLALIQGFDSINWILFFCLPIAWIQLVQAAIMAYGAYKAADDKKKAKKAAEKEQQSSSVNYRSPYMADTLNRMIPYIFSEAFDIYKTRSQKQGRSTGNFDYIRDMLMGIMDQQRNQPLTQGMFSGINSPNLGYQTMTLPSPQDRINQLIKGFNSSSGINLTPQNRDPGEVIGSENDQSISF